MRDDRDEGETATRPVITARLMLKAPNDEERGSVVALAAHPGVAQNLAAAPGDHWRTGGKSFVVIGRAARAIMGVTGYGPATDRPEAIEAATWIGEPWWGRGYATEATQAVIDAAFADTCVAAIWCSNRVSNGRARRVIEKCGFQFREIGMVRSPVTMGAVPVERFVLERRNWTSLKSWGKGDEDEPNASRGRVA